MLRILVGAVLVVLIVGLFWLCGRLICESQENDRRYDNPDDWGSAGDHG